MTPVNADIAGISGIEYYSTPNNLFGRRVRNGYLPPKPEWDDEKKKAWDKYQAMLGRYPGILTFFIQSLPRECDQDTFYTSISGSQIDF